MSIVSYPSIVLWVLKVARTTHPSFSYDAEEVCRLCLAIHRMSNRYHSAMGYFNVPWQKKEVTVNSAEQPFTSLSGILKMHVICLPAMSVVADGPFHFLVLLFQEKKKAFPPFKSLLSPRSLLSY